MQSVNSTSSSRDRRPNFTSRSPRQIHQHPRLEMPETVYLGGSFPLQKNEREQETTQTKISNTLRPCLRTGPKTKRLPSTIAPYDFKAPIPSKRFDTLVTSHSLPPCSLPIYDIHISRLPSRVLTVNDSPSRLQSTIPLGIETVPSQSAQWNEGTGQPS